MAPAAEDPLDTALEELVERFLEERRRGVGAGVEVYAQAHPAYAEELRRLLPAVEELERAGLSVSRRLRREGDAGAELTVDSARITELVRRLAGRHDNTGRYQPKGELARGGQGAVLHVFDEDLSRHLAMKVALSGEASASRPSDSRSLGRFLEEAQVTSQLDHPGIVPVHELGLDSEGRLYFTMKLVEGRTLREILELLPGEQEGWSETRALGVMLKVCEAVAYAHHKGVIHRDLKPANVMVGRFGEVYVMDWGLARVLGAPEERSAALRTERTAARGDTPDSPLFTLEGDVVGTPAYMPPEQARGEIERLSPRSDVYALGAMLYHVLAREMPHARHDAGLSNQAVLALVLQGPPAALHVLRSDVPAELAAIVEKAMAREPEERYGDTLALAEDLRAYLEHRVVKAYETGAVAELRKWVGRNRGLAASIAAAILLLALGLTVSLVLKGVATRRADEVLRLSALQKLDELVADADGLWPSYPENIRAYEAWLARAEELVAELPEHVARRAALRSKARPLTPEEQVAQRSSHPRTPELERTQRHLAFLRAQRGALEAGVPLVDPQPAEVGIDFTGLPAGADELNGLAWPLVDPDRADWGGEAKGLVLARRALGLAAEDQQGFIRDTLAWALFAAGRLEEALAQEEAAVAEVGADRRAELEGLLARMKASVAEETGAGSAQKAAVRVAQLEADLAALEHEVTTRQVWTFDDAEDRWWHIQLEKLIAGLETLSGENGLYSAGMTAGHGWGVKKRLAFALKLRDGFAPGGESARAWAAALPEILAAYPGIALKPQLGLVPIGPDPRTSLWEFAHLQSGAPAVRGPDGGLALDEATGLVLVLLPGGSFDLGAQAQDPAAPNYDPQANPHEGPPHRVTLSPFFLSKYEMTQGQWLRCAGRNPSQYGPHNYPRGANAAGRALDLVQPVEMVSWYDCMEVCRRLELILPSEAQWEYGARGGTTSVWWTGNEKESLQDAVNLADRFFRSKRPAVTVSDDWLDDGNLIHARVGSYRANAFGLHDVLGNVAEWCLDGYLPYDAAIPSGTDPEVEPSRSLTRVSRGGNFGVLSAGARSAKRAGDVPENADDFLGLRPARALVP